MCVVPRSYIYVVLASSTLQFSLVQCVYIYYDQIDNKGEQQREIIAYIMHGIQYLVSGVTFHGNKLLFCFSTIAIVCYMLSPLENLNANAQYI
jgi:hypothetical protein